MWAFGVFATVFAGCSTIYRHAMTNSFSPWTTPFASTANWTRIIFHHEELLVGIITVFVNAVTLPYRRNLVQRFWTSMSAVYRNLLARSTHVQHCAWPATGDSFSLLSLVLLTD